MAYGNWGATVYCDNKPLHKNCDTTPNQVLGKERGYEHYLQHYIQKNTNEISKNIFDDMFHGIVGDKEAGVLVCLYKSWCSNIIQLLKDNKYKIIEKPKFDDWWESEGFTIDVDGISITCKPTQDPEGVSCNFTDKKGRNWNAKSAYGYGEGYWDWD